MVSSDYVLYRIFNWNYYKIRDLTMGISRYRDKWQVNVRYKGYPKIQLVCDTLEEAEEFNRRCIEKIREDIKEKKIQSLTIKEKQ